MGILDYFTPEARRGNREWLDSQNAAISEALRYYLGPTGIPDRLGMLAESTPTAGLERAGTESSRMFAPGLSGWDRMAAAGNMLSETAGAGAGLLGMPAAGRMADDLVEAAAPAVRQFGVGDEGGLKLYHGSPHSFDKFSMDKIGTGEGAQAYGHGLYFAENEGIAKSYRDALSNGWQFNSREPLNASGLSGRDLDVASQMLSTSHSGEAAATDWENWLGKTLTPEQRAAFSDAFSRKGGSMYEVQINADPEKFLDWDRPISEQPQILSLLGMPPIRSYATIFEEADSLMKAGDASVGRKNGWMENPEISARVNDLKKELNQTPSDMSVQNLLMQIGGDVPNPQGFNADRAMVAASDKLRGAGIPGIRYLDAGSRGANDGTRNYVIFDENLISIVRKYGIAGAAAMLGMSQADVAQAMGQQPQGLLESGPQ